MLKQNRWLDSAQLINIMVMENFKPAVNKLIIFEQDFSPNQQKWLSHIQVQNESVIEFVQTDTARKLDSTVEVYQNIEQEIKASAHWARNEYEKNPDRTIAIVVPGLRNCSKQVDSIFRSVFTPAFDLSESEQELFELSITDSIKQTGFIDAAITALELLRPKFDYDCFSLFLRDQYFKDRLVLRQSYSLLDVELRARVQPEESLSHLIQLIMQINMTDNGAASSLVKQVEKLKEFTHSLPVRTSSASWCNVISASLNLLGWPDLLCLNFKEQQLLKQWQQLLAQMCTSGLVTQQLSLSQALAQLNEIAASMPQQRNSNAAIKIIDLDEISQAYYDLAWITGLTDSVLPEKIRLNPLLPFGLQRKHNLPFSTTESSLKHAQLTFSALTNMAKEIRFSYFKNDELTEFRVSPLLSDLQQENVDLPQEVEFTQTQQLNLELYKDDVGKPLELDTIAGGTYLLKTQSACPFQAYAAYRLQANPIDSPQPGLDAAQKGVLVHDVLRRVWQALETKQKLDSLTSDQLEELVNTHIDISLKRLHLEQQLFSSIEKQRLSGLVMKWLNIERLRKLPFKVIQQEHTSSFAVQSISLDIKIDRIDELENGRRLIIDYKTGWADSNQWLRDLDRIEDPQLPVYLLANQGNIDAITFAKLKELKFDGLADGDLGISGIVDVNKGNKFIKQHQIYGLNQLADHWQTSVNRLAQEYLGGFARVNPRDPGTQCKYCQRQSLCRLYQQQALVTEDETSS